MYIVENAFRFYLMKDKHAQYDSVDKYFTIRR